MSEPLELDLALTPFSRRGSYLAVCRVDGPDGDGVYLRSVRGNLAQRELLRLLVAGDSAPAATVEPGRLTLRRGETTLEVVLAGPGRALLRATGGSVVLDLQVPSQYDVVLQQGSSTWRFLASGANRNYLISVAGSASLDKGWDGVRDTAARLQLDAAEAPVLVTIDEFATTAPAFAEDDPDVVAAVAAQDFEEWFTTHAPFDRLRERGLRHAGRLAAYITWAALVPAGGALQRESMLMSKNHMTSIWAWDHCFNALALWRDQPAALDQLLTLFDHQDAAGGLPDYINDAGVEPNFAKPPVHGWAVGWLLDHDALDNDALAALHEPLARWTDWWFTERVYGSDGVPSYNHGNDSGWDNATVFAEGVPVQSPDLLAYLALQQETLARIAARLDRADAAERWRQRAAETIDLLLQRFWDGDRFVARHTLDGRPIRSDSLLTLMPLVLGDRLPSEVFDKTVTRLLEGDYLTAHGAATEPTTSWFYEPDGYWRGPIWAPSTMLLVDGLRRGGRADLAADLARRFVDTCTAAGMAENFDALTGAGLRDRSMTWTASVYLVLLGSLDGPG